MVCFFEDRPLVAMDNLVTLRHIRFFPFLRLVALMLVLLVGQAVKGIEFPGEHWAVVESPESRGYSSEKLAQARQFSERIHSAAVVVVLGGSILTEWGEVERKFKTHSLRKSFLSALYGNPVGDGRINLQATMSVLGIDDVQGLSTEEREATVQDLLKSRSGIYHPALYETAGMKRLKPERFTQQAGTHWYYNNWDFNAAGTIYQQLTGNSIYQAIKDEIAVPIGMEHYEVTDGSYVEGDESIHAAYPFRISARDLARFGLLMLRGGNWHGQQVIPKDWVAESTRYHSDAALYRADGYGYMWWVVKPHNKFPHFPGVELPEGGYSARGAGGHFLLVIPEKDMVIVHRVNTDVRGTSVSSQDRGRLVNLILSAEIAPAELPALTKPYQFLIRRATVVDGSGKASYLADVAVSDDSIVAISQSPLPVDLAEEVIESSGLVVAPGFIDMHAHIDPLERLPAAESMARQGITTALGGPDGSSPWPLGEYLDQAETWPLGINVAYLVGHNRIRSQIMGVSPRPPSATELETMKQMVADAMEAGALGMSTGLKYLPGTFAKTEEIIALSKIAAAHGGIYTSHLREEGLGLIDAVSEAIEIGKQADIPIVLTHHKAVGQPTWGASIQTLQMVDGARAEGIDVMLDQYPYTATSTGISIIVPAWARAGGAAAFHERSRDAVTREKILSDIRFNLENDRGGGDLRRIQFAQVPWDRSLEGKRLYDWVLRQGLEPTLANGATLVLEAALRGGMKAIYHVLDERDVERIMKHPMTMFGSDGRLTQPGEGHPHPRWYGSFPRILGQYVREKEVLRLEEAIHKMTGMPAERLGIRDRGRIQVGMKADLVVFNPETIRDRATFEDPHQYSIGVEYVFVNGKPIVTPGGLTNYRTGEVIRHRGKGL